MELIRVDLGDGRVSWHTPEQYEQLWKGVDREVCEAMDAPIEVEEDS